MAVAPGPGHQLLRPLDGWDEFWFYVSPQGYGGVDVSPAAGWSDHADVLAPAPGAPAREGAP